MAPNDYHQDTEADCTTYTTEHRNGERTRVHLIGDEGRYTIIAVDYAKKGLEATNSKIVAVTATLEEAEKRADQWMEENPKGIRSGLVNMLSGGD